MKASKLENIKIIPNPSKITMAIIKIINVDNINNYGEGMCGVNCTAIPNNVLGKFLKVYRSISLRTRETFFEAN